MACKLSKGPCSDIEEGKKIVRGNGAMRKVPFVVKILTL